MRDIKRVRKFCNQLATAWELLPDWRFGQLLFNIFEKLKTEGIDPFYIEDDSMLEYIKKYIEKYTGVSLHE